MAGMDAKEYKKMNRRELLELLIDEVKRNSMLEKENESLKKQLADRLILSDRAGSIAEAALQLNRIFEAADAAAKDYVENVRRLSERKEEAAQSREESWESVVAELE